MEFLLTNKREPLITALWLPGVSGTMWGRFAMFLGPGNIQTVLVAAPVIWWIVTIVPETQRHSVNPLECLRLSSCFPHSSNPKPLVSLAEFESNESVLRGRMNRGYICLKGFQSIRCNLVLYFITNILPLAFDIRVVPPSRWSDIGGTGNTQS